MAATPDRNNRLGGAFPVVMFPVFVEYAVRSPHDNQVEWGSFAVEVTAVNDPFTLAPHPFELTTESDSFGINVKVVSVRATRFCTSRE